MSGKDKGTGVVAAASPASFSSSSTTIPSTTKKIVQSLKEIVNCTETEIYAMLKECNMDPSETVNRLLSQDTFHEVKSKRDKKKEIKDTLESKSRIVSSMSNRGGRAGTDRAGRVSSVNASSSEHGSGLAVQGKQKSKKENGPNTTPSSSNSGFGVIWNGNNKRSLSLSSASAVTPTVAVSTADVTTMSSQLSACSQNVWSAVPGQISLADIVKMGRPQPRVSGNLVSTAEASFASFDSVTEDVYRVNVKHSTSEALPAESHQNLYSSKIPTSKVSEIVSDPSSTSGNKISQNGWSLGDQLPAGNISHVMETSCTASITLGLNDGGSDAHALETHCLKENIENATAGFLHPDLLDEQVYTDNPASESNLNETSDNHISPSQFQNQEIENHQAEGNDVGASSVTASLQHLELNVQAPENIPPVKFPDHLQVADVQCSHLSFGSFGSGISAKYSSSLTSDTLKNNLDAAPLASVSPVNPSDDRKSDDYHNDEPLRSTSDNDTAPTTSSAGELDQQSSSQHVNIVSDTTDPQRGLQNDFSSLSSYGFNNTTQSSTMQHDNAQYYTELNSQGNNLTPLNSVQVYTNPLPGNTLNSASRFDRELDLPFLSLHPTQSIAAKFNSEMYASGPSAISLPETVKPTVFSLSQQTPQIATSTGILTGSSLPQHPSVQHYSQPSLPLNPFGNMIGYSFLPQSYAFMPSAAFQQAYTGNNAYHHSATVPGTSIKYSTPQYKSGASVTSLQQTASAAPGYGGFGSSSNNIPGNFVHNPSASPNAAVGYDNALRAQYKDGSHYASLQHQGDNSTMWLHGSGSRAVTTLPGSSLYSLHGQSQHSGFRQAQQASQYAAPGYRSLYLSQVGIPQDNQQNPIEGNLSGSQGIPSQSSNHIWQSTY